MEIMVLQSESHCLNSFLAALFNIYFAPAQPSAFLTKCQQKLISSATSVTQLHKKDYLNPWMLKAITNGHSFSERKVRNMKSHKHWWMASPCIPSPLTSHHSLAAIFHGFFYQSDGGYQTMRLEYHRFWSSDCLHQPEPQTTNLFYKQ